jgi:hypothetical protein
MPAASTVAKVFAQTLRGACMAGWAGMRVHCPLPAAYSQPWYAQASRFSTTRPSVKRTLRCGHRLSQAWAVPSAARQSASSWPWAKPATMLAPGRRSAARATGCQVFVS